MKQSRKSLPKFERDTRLQSQELHHYAVLADFVIVPVLMW